MKIFLRIFIYILDIFIVCVLFVGCTKNRPHEDRFISMMQFKYPLKFEDKKELAKRIVKPQVVWDKFISGHSFYTELNAENDSIKVHLDWEAFDHYYNLVNVSVTEIKKIVCNDVTVLSICPIWSGTISLKSYLIGMTNELMIYRLGGFPTNDFNRFLKTEIKEIKSKEKAEEIIKFYFEEVEFDQFVNERIIDSTNQKLVFINFKKIIPNLKIKETQNYFVSNLYTIKNQYLHDQYGREKKLILSEYDIKLGKDATFSLVQKTISSKTIDY